MTGSPPTVAIWDAQMRSCDTESSQPLVALNRVLRTAMGLPTGPVARFLRPLLHSDTGVPGAGDNDIFCGYMRKIENIRRR
jgi:hypothetical protein